jgi:hypothetical protein
MEKLDPKMTDLAQKVLRRPLSEEERLEIFQISDALGMNNVQSFLYLILVFKLHEDTMKMKTDKIEAISERINENLRRTVELRKDGAEDDTTGEGQGGRNEIQGGYKEFFTVRAYILISCYVGLLVTLSYWLGSRDVLRMSESAGPLDTLLHLPAGWCFIAGGMLYAFTWSFDNWKRVKRYRKFKAMLGLQVFVVVALLAYMI